MEPDVLRYSSVIRMLDEETKEWTDIEILVWESGFITWRKWEGVPSASGDE